MNRLRANILQMMIRNFLTYKLYCTESLDAIPVECLYIFLFIPPIPAISLYSNMNLSIYPTPSIPSFPYTLHALLLIPFPLFLSNQYLDITLLSILTSDEQKGSSISLTQPPPLRPQILLQTPLNRQLLPQNQPPKQNFPTLPREDNPQLQHQTQQQALSQPTSWILGGALLFSQPETGNAATKGFRIENVEEITRGSEGFRHQFIE